MKKLFAMCLIALLLWGGAALAQQAQDLTEQCVFRGTSNGKELRNLYDNKYKSHWKSQGGAAGKLTITLPEGKEAHSLYIQWYDRAVPTQVLVPEGEGWAQLTQASGSYLAEYIQLPKGAAKFRLSPGKGVKSRMSIAEIRIFGEGEVPLWVQKWQPPAEKADLLVVFAHPDDEVLFMGGTIPYYAGEMQKNVQVACMTRSMPYRRLELLDAMWLCGVKNYPDIGALKDSFTLSRKKMYQIWGEDRSVKLLAQMYRQYKPEVVVTHDLNGEYGHGAHKVTAEAAVRALERAADPGSYQDLRERYGVWDVPKLYLHLYEENVVDMDWHRP
ncbi:MAG: PIG-L family deacetylase, partial [Clostridia bacterium]|nr:PIG-L family deacetylase [Clostridia bacterium]